MASSADSADSVEISNITIKSSTIIGSIKLSIGTLQRNFELAKNKSKEAGLPLESDRLSLPSSTPLTIRVKPERLLQRSKKIEIKRQDLLSDTRTVDASTNKREYRITVNEIELVIQFILPQAPGNTEGTELRPTTDTIFNICPRFRVLVIGRTGVGKTSLIKNTFGVTDVLISHNQVGVCDINKELSSSDENKRFVLHDSMGFEPGDQSNFDTVMNFLKDRKNRPEVKDQVHAVWMCFSIPINGERLFETGAENFFRALSEGDLGRMPIIAIFTKYDKLVNQVRIYGDFEGLQGETLQARINLEAKAKLDELCVKPFREIVGNATEIPGIEVSTASDEYKDTLHKLTQDTTQLVKDYLTEEVAVLSAVAQQVSPKLKIQAVIDVGKKRYWQGLASTIDLPGNGPEIVLQNIHHDIVRIWNLQDPQELLDSKEFKEFVVVMASESDAPSQPLKGDMATSLSMLGALAGIVSALSGPATPIVIPIVAGVVAVHWTYLLLRKAGIVLQRLMNYIVALTLIMQIIFSITTTTHNVVSRRLIKLALKTFQDSQKSNVHYAIKEHFEPRGINLGRDAALAKIIDLIKKNQISLEDMAKIKDTMKDFNIAQDEPWVEASIRET